MKIVFLLLVLACGTAHCSKLLVVFPFTGGSHYMLGNGIVRALVEAGHDVTFISSKAEKNPPKEGGKWTDVVLTGFLDETEKIFDQTNTFGLTNVPLLFRYPIIVGIAGKVTRTVFSHPNVQKLLKSGEKFDAVLVEQFIYDGVKIFAHIYDAPMILVSCIGANNMVNRFVGNPNFPSYIPEAFISYSSEMSFVERVHNTLTALMMDVLYHLFMLPNQNQIVQEFFPNAPHLNDFMYNTSLVFLNSHPSISQPKPQVPAMVEIGGYHIKPPKKLPKDLQDYLDNSKDGLVYFSMGSRIKSIHMPEEKRNIIMKAFSKLKLNVLWKWEEDSLPGQPKNVKIGTWLPQNDILAHTNVKLFITHGGLLSTTETIYHGKPILALPVGGDQQLNAAQAVNNGFALKLSIMDLTEEDFLNAINELLNNPKYYENAQRRSKIMHDRPQTPQQALVYWTEYVIRHQGAPHLRVAAVDLNWYQYLLLDVFAFLTGCLLLILLIVKLVFKKIFIRKKIDIKNKVKKN